MSDARVTPMTLSTLWHSFRSICKEIRHVIDRTLHYYLIAPIHDV